MALDEEEMFDDLADEEAEGAAEAFDEFDEFPPSCFALRRSETKAGR